MHKTSKLSLYLFILFKFTLSQLNESTSSPVTDTTITPTVLYTTDDASYTKWINPITDNNIIYDIYSRQELSIEILEEFQSITWQYRDIIDNNKNRWSDWSPVPVRNDKYIKIINSRTDSNSTISSLILLSMRNENSGYCFDNNTISENILNPNKIYQFRLQISPSNSGIDRRYSSIKEFITYKNQLPNDISCNIIQNDTQILNTFNIECMYDNNDTLNDIMYNIMISDILISGGYSDDITSIDVMVPSGDIEVVILIKPDYDYSISCYHLSIDFPNLNTTDHDHDIVDDMYNIISDTDLGAIDNNHIVVALKSVIDELYDSNTSNIIRDIVMNVIASSYIMNYDYNNISNAVVISGDYILSELNTILLIISDYEYINSNDAVLLISTLINDYIPTVFDLIDLYMDDNDDLYISDRLSFIMTSLQTIMSYLDGMITVIGSSNDVGIDVYINKMVYTLFDYSMLSASLALSKSIPGESFTYKFTNDKQSRYVTAVKYQSANYINDTYTSIQPSCGNKKEYFQIPFGYINYEIDTFNCIFMTSSVDNFIIDDESTSISNIIAFDIFENDVSSRRLQELDYNDTDTGFCGHYLITALLTDDKYRDNQSIYELDKTSKFPLCSLLTVDNDQNVNVSAASWDGEDCFVVDYTDDTVTCGCREISILQLTDDTFTPESIIDIEWKWNEFTTDNVFDTNASFTVFIIIIVFVGISVILCFVSHLKLDDNVIDDPIIFDENIIYQSIYNENVFNDVSGIEFKEIDTNLPNPKNIGKGFYKIALTPTDERMMVYLTYRLSMVYIKNYSILFPIFLRNNGTNYSSKQRIGCLLLYILSVMVLTALVYYLQYPLSFSDLEISLVIPLIAYVPIIFIRKIFLYSKTDKIERTVKEIDANASSFDLDPNAGHDNIRGMPQLLDDYSSAPDANTKPIELYDDVKDKLISKIYPFSSKCNILGWVIVIGLCGYLSYLTIACALQFGLDYSVETNDFTESCWENNLKYIIETNLSNNYLTVESSKLITSFSTNYVSNNNDLIAWIISIIISLIIFILISEPLIIYISTWIKILMFILNIDMNINCINCIKCIRLSCSGNKGCKCCINRDKNQKINYIYNKYKTYKSYSADINSNKISFLSSKYRPFDVIAFLSNKAIFINDIKQEENDGKKEEKKQEKDGNKHQRDKPKVNAINNKEEKEEEDENENDDKIDDKMITHINYNESNLNLHYQTKTDELDEMIIELQDILYTKTDSSLNTPL